MSLDFNKKALTVVVAQICQTIGWHSINSTPLDMLVDLLHRYMLKIGQNAHRYAEQLGHTQPDLDDLGLAFMDMGISVEDLQEYVQCVETVPFVKEVPKYPIPRESHLNFLKPGSKEVVTRPVYVHEHLPPMHPELEGDEYKTENGSTPAPEAGSPVNGYLSGSPSVTGSNGSVGTVGSGGQTNGQSSAPNSGPNSPLPNGASAVNIHNPFKRPSDPVCIESPAAKRARLIMEEEGRPLREISSVMMTTSGFLSPAREGKLPESRTPIAASDARATSPQPSHYPAVPPQVNKEKKKKLPDPAFRFAPDGKKKNAFLPPDLPLDYSNVAKLDSMKELGKLKALKPARRSLPPGVNPAPKLPKKAIPKIANRHAGMPFAKNPKVVRTLIPEKNPLKQSHAIPMTTPFDLQDPDPKLTASPDKRKLNIFKKISKGTDDKGKRAGDSNLAPLDSSSWNHESIDRKPLDTTVSVCIENVIRRGMEEVDKSEALQWRDVKREKDLNTSSDSFVDVTGTSPLPMSPPLRTFKSPDPVHSAQRKIKHEERVIRKLEKAKNKKKLEEYGNNPLFMADDPLAINVPLKNSQYPIVKMPKTKKRKKERPEESTWEIQPPRQHFPELDDYPDYHCTPGVVYPPPVEDSSWTLVSERSPASPPAVQILPPEVRSPIHTIDISSPERPAQEATSRALTPVAMSPEGLAAQPPAPPAASPQLPTLPGVSVSLVQLPSHTTPTETATSPTKKKLGAGKLKGGEKDFALTLSRENLEEGTCDGQIVSQGALTQGALTQGESHPRGSLVLVLKKEHKKDKKDKKDKIKKKKEKKDKHKAKEKDLTKKKEEGKKNKEKKKKKKKDVAIAGAAATPGTLAEPAPAAGLPAAGLPVQPAAMPEAPAQSVTPQSVPSAPESSSALPRITLKLSSGTASPPPDAPLRKAAAKPPKKAEVPYQPELFSSSHFIESESYRREKEKEREKEREREREREREKEREREREREREELERERAIERERERLLEEERERVREREREEERERQRKEKEREWAREMEEKQRAEAQARSSTSLPASSPPPLKSSKSKSSKTHKYPSTGMRFTILPEIPPTLPPNKEKKKKKKTSSHRDLEEAGYSSTEPILNHTYAPSPEPMPIQPVYPVAPVVYEENEGNKVWICPSCNGPDDGRPMIGCDGCDEWYHWVCVGIEVAPAENEDWYCTGCISRKATERVSKKKKKSRKKKQGA